MTTGAGDSDTMTRGRRLAERVTPTGGVLRPHAVARGLRTPERAR